MSNGKSIKRIRGATVRKLPQKKPIFKSSKKGRIHVVHLPDDDQEDEEESGYQILESKELRAGTSFMFELVEPVVSHFRRIEISYPQYVAKLRRSPPLLHVQGFKSYLSEHEPWERGKPLPGPIEVKRQSSGQLVLITRATVRKKQIVIASYPSQGFTIIASAEWAKKHAGL